MTPCISGILRKTGRSGKNVTYTRDISCKMKASLAHNKNIFAKTFPIVYSCTKNRCYEHKCCSPDLRKCYPNVI